MTVTFIGIDSEFAASTGSNVNTSPNSSRFDNPPQGSKELLITSNEGDDDPRNIEVGDSYDISWSGQGGGTMEDAVVIRSDPSPDGPGTGIVVFEGTLENGDAAQIIWTPGFDLEGWYSANFNPSMEPEFYTEDMDGTYHHKFVCFASETRIMTPAGPKPVGGFRSGDLVTTKDEGDNAVLWAGKRICAATGENAPVVFEPGAIGNAAPVRLSQQHRVLITSPIVQYYFGINEAFVPAKACVNGHTIHIAPESRICYVHLLLEKHHVIWAEGLECETLFLGDQARKALYGFSDAQQTNPFPLTAHPTQKLARPALNMHEARLLMHHVHTASQATQNQIGLKKGPATLACRM